MVCSFTGHRTIANEHREKLVALLRRAIAFCYEEGCRDFLAGGALGFDTLAAREVILFRMSHPDVNLRLILPCHGQDAAWSKSERDSYAFILGSADSVEYLADTYTDGCMRRRNERLARDCDILVAYAGRYRSGAAQTVRLAESFGKRVYNIYPHC